MLGYLHVLLHHANFVAHAHSLAVESVIALFPVIATYSVVHCHEANLRAYQAKEWQESEHEKRHYDKDGKYTYSTYTYSHGQVWTSSPGRWGPSSFKRPGECARKVQSHLSHIEEAGYEADVYLMISAADIMPNAAEPGPTL